MVLWSYFTISLLGVIMFVGIHEGSASGGCADLKQLLIDLPNQRLGRSPSANITEEFDKTAIEESELDEMWSFVGNKSNPRWL